MRNFGPKNCLAHVSVGFRLTMFFTSRWDSTSGRAETEQSGSFDQPMCGSMRPILCLDTAHPFTYFIRQSLHYIVYGLVHSWLFNYSTVFRPSHLSNPKVSLFAVRAKVKTMGQQDGSRGAKLSDRQTMDQQCELRQIDWANWTWSERSHQSNLTTLSNCFPETCRCRPASMRHVSNAHPMGRSQLDVNCQTRTIWCLQKSRKLCHLYVGFPSKSLFMVFSGLHGGVINEKARVDMTRLLVVFYEWSPEGGSTNCQCLLFWTLLYCLSARPLSSTVSRSRSSIAC